MKQESQANRSIWVVLTVFAVIALLLAASGYWLYRKEFQSIREDAFKELKAIGELKVGQIVLWRNERMNDAQFISSGPFLRSVLKRWLESGGDAVMRTDIRDRMEAMQRYYTYDNVMVTAPDGRLLVSLNPSLTVLDDNARRLVSRAVSSGGAVFGDFFRCPDCGQIHLDVVVPILDLNNQPLAVLILRNDPEKHLYPLIQSWPTPSPSAETLLIRKEGNEALFLNVLRHVKDPALTLRIPLSSSEVPAVQALLGKTGEFEGRDYRGVEVLADIRPVPGSPWIMIAKVDSAEMLAEARYRGAVTSLVTLMLILLTGLGAGFLYKHQGKRTFQALYRAERERREAREQFRAILYSIGDAVITTDTEGRVRHMNPVAEQLTGWVETEARGKVLHEVFRIINEETRLVVENPVQLVLRRGQVVGLANHTLLIARDSTERPIADSGAPIFSETGDITGVVLVFRDQTSERAAAKALFESEETNRITFEQAPVGIAHVSPDGRWLRVNDKLCAIVGYERDELMHLTFQEITHPDDLNADLDSMNQLLEGHIRTYTMEKRYLHKDRAVVWADLTVSLVRSASGEPRHFISVIEDISERKRAEEELRQSREDFARAFNSSPTAMAITRLSDGKFLNLNEAYTKIMEYQPAEIIGRTTADMKIYVHPDERGQLVNEVLKEGAVRNYELSVRNRSGEIRSLLISMERILYDNEASILSSFLDITEHKRADEALRNSLAEKVALLKEVHHRVKNNLQIVASLLNLQARRVKDDTLAAILRDTRSRVHSMALLHEMLYHSGNLAQVNFFAYVEELCRQLRLSFGSAAARVRMVNRVACIGLPLEQSVPCALIINELVCNALKHGFPKGREGEVAVGLRPDEGETLVLKVMDNGVGLPSDFDPANSDTLGLQLVSNLAAQLGGQFTVGGPGKAGAAFSVVFSASEAMLREVNP